MQNYHFTFGSLQLRDSIAASVADFLSTSFKFMSTPDESEVSYKTTQYIVLWIPVIPGKKSGMGYHLKEKYKTFMDETSKKRMKSKATYQEVTLNIYLKKMKFYSSKI